MPDGGGRDADDRARVHDSARTQFAATAEAYVHSAIHAAGDDLARLIEAITARLGSLAGRPALDVATGGGHTALALARAGAVVTASDLTPEMLAAAEAHLREAAPDAGVRFVRAAAEGLPFDGGAFEVVTCRIAAHHFADPRAFLAEARRVLAPGGVLGLIDNIAPEDVAAARGMNDVERLRDPSHVEAYPVSRWLGWAGEAGLEPVHLERFWRHKELETWLRRARTSAENEAALRAMLEAAPAPVRRYLLAPSGEASAPSRLRHEVMLLVASAGPV